MNFKNLQARGALDPAYQKIIAIVAFMVILVAVFGKPLTGFSVLSLVRSDFTNTLKEYVKKEETRTNEC